MALSTSGNPKVQAGLEYAERNLNTRQNAIEAGGLYEQLPAEFHVYLFTCGRRATVAHHALLPYVEVPACAKDQRYVRFGIPIPEPYAQRRDYDDGMGGDPFIYHRGRAGAQRIAMDICQPNNPTLDQSIYDYGNKDPYFAVQDGVNLSKWGVFWSKNLEPTEEEIARAEKKRDQFYRGVLAKYDEFFTADPATAKTKATQIGFDFEDVRLALERFGEKRPYYSQFTVHKNCPNCNASIAENVFYHTDADGDLCVIGQQGWRRVVSSGKRKKDDVPEEYVWWGTKKKNGIASAAAEIMAASDSAEQAE
jgi:hypothetical protein